MPPAPTLEAQPAPAGTAPLLSVRDLSIGVRSAGGMLGIVDGVSFDIAPGEIVGLVGESGCGKSITSLTIMGLQALQPSIAVSGQILFDGKDILSLSRRALRRLAGEEIAMIFQEPMTALDPVFTIGEQIAETVLAHRSVSRAEAKRLAIQALADVEIPDPARRYDAYPHQLSGGMRQRAMIAMAIVCQPRLLIADEPTTALDVTIQAQIVTLLRGLSQRNGMAVILVTHDLGLVAQNCERVLTMYAGQIVEEAATDAILAAPRHPYTSGLLRAIPALVPRKSELVTIPGRVPSVGAFPEGCRFRPRCPHAAEPCRATQPMRQDGAARVRCCRADELTLRGVWE